MREIKFRAWDKFNRNMIQDVSTHRNDEGDINPWEFMQFTGLRDKNGKEIYEGDLILFSGGKRSWTIAWQSKAARWVGFSDGTAILNLFDERQKYEVIGNIHENGEHLK